MSCGALLVLVLVPVLVPVLHPLRNIATAKVVGAMAPDHFRYCIKTSGRSRLANESRLSCANCVRILAIG
jgi:hypothetical protein